LMDVLRQLQVVAPDAATRAAATDAADRIRRGVVADSAAPAAAEAPERGDEGQIHAGTRTDEPEPEPDPESGEIPV
jgi:hypothetical protein